MMKRIVLIAVIGVCGVCAAFSSFAQSRSLTVDLAQENVDITTGFDGGNLILFGEKSRGGDVAVVLFGPKKDFVVRQKKQVAGAWLNSRRIKFADVPVFYDVAMSVKEEDLLPPKILKEERIGLGSLKFSPKNENLKDSDKVLFQNALLRNKQAEGLFPSAAKDVDFLSDTFFKATLHVPANVPTGQYVIKTYLIKDKKIVDRRLTNVTVAQVGFSAGVYQFANSYAFVYALLTVFIAVWAGWLSNAVRKRK